MGTFEAGSKSAKDRNRRVSPIGPNPGEGLLTEPTPAVRPWSAGTRLHAPFRPSAGLRGRLPNPGKAVIRLTLEQRVI